MPKTWFLPPDFTFTEDGPLRLGMILSHWSKPGSVLAELGSGTASALALPPIKTIIEPDHAHYRSTTRSGSLAIWSKFEGLASALVGTDAGKSRSIDYSQTDHEIRSFVDPLSPETTAAIAKLPSVHEHITSGLFGRRYVYVVTGLRIATSSFTVTVQNETNYGVSVEGSGPALAVAPLEVGAGLSHQKANQNTDTYSTAPGIVFAYQMHIIRTYKAGSEVDIFQHKGAFMTGDGTANEHQLLLVEATEAEIGDDLDDQAKHEAFCVDRDNVCIRAKN